MLQKNPLDVLLRALTTDEVLAGYYQTYKDLIVAGIEGIGRQGVILDLEQLPTEPYPLKRIVLTWLMHVNRDRFKEGKPPIVTYEVVMACPVWKFIAPPFRRVPMTKDELLGARNLNRRTAGGQINRSRKR